MKDLESNLNRIFEAHQHESGLHVIGGRRKLMDRLIQFFEEGLVPERPDPGPCLPSEYRPGDCRQN